GRNQFRRVVGTEVCRWSAGFEALFNQRGAGTPPEEDAENARESGAAAPSSAGAASRGLSACVGPTLSTRLANFVPLCITLDYTPRKHRHVVLDLRSVLHVRETHMMGHCKLTRKDLNGCHPGILGEAARDDEPRPFDNALDGNVVGWSLDDVVRFDLPPVLRPSHR